MGSKWQFMPKIIEGQNSPLQNTSARLRKSLPASHLHRKASDLGLQGEKNLISLTACLMRLEANEILFALHG